MASIFSKIITGEIPCYKVGEDEKHLAFLDIQPLSPGHVLVIPKKETDYIFDLEDEELAELMVFAKKIALRLKMAVPCRKVSITVIGIEVPHAHVHLIPLNKMADCNFSGPKMETNHDDLKAMAERINQY